MAGPSPASHDFRGRARTRVTPYYARMLGNLSHTRVLRLAGLFTWSLVSLPLLYTQYAPAEGELPRKLDAAKAASVEVEKLHIDQATFEKMHAADRMASDKLAEGIAGFTKALETLETLLADRLAALEA